MDALPGAYALILQADQPRIVQIGRLGQLAVEPGCYVYVGSALGPGGVRARVGHHVRMMARPHWHIDYLRRAAALRHVWYSYDAVRREHMWADIFANMSGAAVPLPGFGASDCACLTHLYFFSRQPRLDTFRRRLRAAVPQHSRVNRMSAIRNSASCLASPDWSIEERG